MSPLRALPGPTQQGLLEGSWRARDRNKPAPNIIQGWGHHMQQHAATSQRYPVGHSQRYSCGRGRGVEPVTGRKVTGFPKAPPSRIHFPHPQKNFPSKCSSELMSRMHGNVPCVCLFLGRFLFVRERHLALLRGHSQQAGGTI